MSELEKFSRPEGRYEVKCDSLCLAIKKIKSIQNNCKENVFYEYLLLFDMSVPTIAIMQMQLVELITHIASPSFRR